MTCAQSEPTAAAGSIVVLVGPLAVWPKPQQGASDRRLAGALKLERPPRRHRRVIQVNSLSGMFSQLPRSGTMDPGPSSWHALMYCDSAEPAPSGSRMADEQVIQQGLATTASGIG